MKLLRFTTLAILLFSMLMGFNSCYNEANAHSSEKIKNQSTTAVATAALSTSLTWHSIDELDALQKKEPRKVIVDVYTDWCKWCKVMDQKTFKEPSVIEYLNQNYYAVKFNAEDQRELNFKGKSYSFEQGTRRGHHQLAAHLCDGQLSYPSVVVLDESLNKLSVKRGYTPAPDFIELLKKTAVKI